MRIGFLRSTAVALALLGLSMAPASALQPGDVAPALSLPTADGRTLDLASLRGRVVYVDFWASWCTPCKRSFPWMNELAARFGGQGLEIVAVNVDKRREDAQKFLAVVPARFAVAFDDSGRTPAAWQVTAMPSSYLVDAAGRVLVVERGFRESRKAELEAHIRAALDGR